MGPKGWWRHLSSVTWRCLEDTQQTACPQGWALTPYFMGAPLKSLAARRKGTQPPGRGQGDPGT